MLPSARTAGISINFLIGIFVDKALEKGEEQNLEVKPHRPVLNVIEIILNPFLDRRIAPVPVYLRPPG